VRGGTYFSLPPQRKVGKRKRLTPPALDLCPRAPNVPTLHTPVLWLLPVANASYQRLTRFNYPYPGQRQRRVYAAQVANCVQVVASYRVALLPGGTRALLVWSEACGAPRADTQFATWAAVDCLVGRAETQVSEAGEAHRKSVGNERGSRGCRVKRKNLWGPSGKN